MKWRGEGDVFSASVDVDGCLRTTSVASVLGRLLVTLVSRDFDLVTSESGMRETRAHNHAIRFCSVKQKSILTLFFLCFKQQFVTNKIRHGLKVSTCTCN